MAGLAETIIDLVPDDDPKHAGLSIERLHVELPLEFYVRRRGDACTIESSAPSQRIQTSIVPVLHRAAIAIQVQTDEGNGA